MSSPPLYPLWSFNFIRLPRRLRNSSISGVVSLFAKSSSSKVWPYFWYKTPNLKLITSKCSSYPWIRFDAIGHITGVNWSTISCSFSSLLILIGVACSPKQLTGIISCIVPLFVLNRILRCACCAIDSCLMEIKTGPCISS